MNEHDARWASTIWTSVLEILNDREGFEGWYEDQLSGSERQELAQEAEEAIGNHLYNVREQALERVLG